MNPNPTHIPFNLPCLTGQETAYFQQCLEKKKFSGDGPFTKKSTDLLCRLIGAERALLTTSCTDALEICALLLDLAPGDEVIVPSFTFVTSASAFALRGAKIVFVEIDPATMNIDPEKAKAAISPRTKAIVIVHYGGVSCDMDAILALAREHDIPVVEDAAQALMAKHKNTYLGTLGDLGCFSFHETKNLQCGEGGALIVNNSKYFERAEILREKGTNRSRFFRGQVDKYTWTDIGSSFLMSDLSAAFLLAQLENAAAITERRLSLWKRYHAALAGLEASGTVQLAKIPDYASPNGHLFYLKLANLLLREKFIAFLAKKNISAVFHYIPLHSSPAGRKCSIFHGSDSHTTIDSERLVRLPIYDAMDASEQGYVIGSVKEFFKF